MPRTRGERQRQERRKSFSRIKGRKRRISSSSEEEDEPWNTSLAVHETPSGEGEEFLCPYFDGSKLILPPGYENYKKKVEKDDGKSVIRSSVGKTLEGAPLRRSSRSSKSKKPMYIYSDEDSSGFEDSKLSSAIASGTPVPTCMFVNAGVAGGSGIDVNKEVFKTLPQTKGLSASSSRCADDERIEFTIEINESSDEDDSDGTKPTKVVMLPEDGDGSKSNINGVNEAKSEVTEPDIKVKEDPIFLSDDEVISKESVKNGKHGDQGDDLRSNNVGSSSLSQKEALEPKTDSNEHSGQKRDDLETPASGETVTEHSAAIEKSENDTSRSSPNTERAVHLDHDSVVDAKDLIGENEKPNERLNSNDSGNESSTDNKEIEVNVHNERNDKNDECLKTKMTEESKLSQVGECFSTKTLDPRNSNLGNENITVTEDEHALSCVDTTMSMGREPESETNVRVNDSIGTSFLESKDALKIDEHVNLCEAEENKSEKADSEKTEEMEPEPEHPLISEIKGKMKEYCSQRVHFNETLDLSGNLVVTADNEKPVRGSIEQKIRKAECAAVDKPVPTVCVPQELSNLVQKFCKEKLQYSVELLIQGEIYATIDETLVSTICNFSFEPEEDDF